MVTQLFLVCLCALSVHSHRTLIDGDVFIEGLFMVRDQNGTECGKLLEESAKYYVAAYWTILSLNKQNYIPGVKLGFRLHETCGSPEKASHIAYNITSGLHTTYSRAIAILGPESSEEADRVSIVLSALPDNKRLLQIGFSTTAASLSDKSRYKNFFRVIPSDRLQTKALLKFIETLKWTYFAVFYQNDKYGKEVLAALEDSKKSSQYPLCLPMKTPVFTDTLEEYKVELNLMSFEKYDPPIPGILVIGRPNLSRKLLKVVNLLQAGVKDHRIPVMLFMDGFPMTEFNNDTYNVTNGMYFFTPPLLNITEMETLTNKILQAENISGTFTEFDDTFLQLLHLPFTYTQYVVQAALTIAKVTKSLFENRKEKTLWDIPKNDFINKMNFINIDLGDFGQFRIDGFNKPALILSFPNGQADAVWNTCHSSQRLPTYSVRNKRRCEQNPEQFCLDKIFQYFENDDRSELFVEEIRDYQFVGNAWRETKYPNIRIPQCPDGHVCSACLDTHGKEVEVIQSPNKRADMYIVGIVPVHSDSINHFKCGNISSAAYDVVEAIRFKIEQQLQSDSRIGAIIIDTCNNPDIVLNKLTNLFTKGITIDGFKEKVDNKILGFVGGHFSDIALKVAERLTQLNYVQISYATSTSLSNRQKYPYFMRIVKSDTHQAKALLKIVKDMESNLVQILYSKTSYGMDGKNAILQYAEEFDICVANTVGIENKDLGNLTNVKELLSFSNSPKTIILFLSSFHVEKIIDTLDSMKGYRFVASEEWGHRYFVSKTGNLDGTITLAYELRMGSLKEYFERIEQPLPSENPWLAEYIQKVFNCSFDWSFDKTRRTCGPDDIFRPVCVQVERSCYKIETWAPFAMYAVEALLRGARKTLRQLCGKESGICDEFRAKPMALVENIRGLKFDYDGVSIRPLFDDNNEGLVDYNSYYIHVSPTGKAEYIRMSDVKEKSKWSESTCDAIKNPKCDECFHKEPGDNNSVLNGSITAVVIVLVVAFVIGGICLCRWWRKNRQADSRNTYSGVYTTPEEGSDGYVMPSDIPDHRQFKTEFKTHGKVSHLDKTDQMDSQEATRMTPTTCGRVCNRNVTEEIYIMPMEESKSIVLPSDVRANRHIGHTEIEEKSAGLISDERDLVAERMASSTSGQTSDRNNSIEVYVTPNEESEDIALPSDISEHCHTAHSEIDGASAEMISDVHDRDQDQIHSQAATGIAPISIADSTSAGAEFNSGQKTDGKNIGGVYVSGRVTIR